MAERVRCESIILEVTGLKPIRSKVLLIRGLFLFFLFSLYKVALSLAFAKRTFASVYHLESLYFLF